MNLLYIGKYPPLQGGTSSAAFWRMLEYKKHNIIPYIITATRDDEYFINNAPSTNNHHIICKKMSWHIPYTQLFSERLISKSLELAKDIDFDIIEGNYLFPYGFAAYMVAKLLSKPLIIRHAGSDLFRLAKNTELTYLVQEMLRYSHLVVTYYDCKDYWKRFPVQDINLRFVSRYKPNTDYFKKGPKNGTAVFLGKITNKWDKAQLDVYWKQLMQFNFNNNIIIFSSSPLADEFVHYFHQKGINVIKNNFIPPIEVPNILSHASYVLCSVLPTDVIEHSNIAEEASTCECHLIGNVSCIPTPTTSTDYKNYILEQISLYKL